MEASSAMTHHQRGETFSPGRAWCRGLTVAALMALTACAPRASEPGRWLDAVMGTSAWWHGPPPRREQRPVPAILPPPATPPMVVTTPAPSFRAATAADVKALHALLQRPRGALADTKKASSRSRSKTRPAVAQASLAWPLQGVVLVRFGERPNGVRSDGIDIAAAPGAEVHAVERGTVIYAGSDLSAYGSLVLIQHANGLTTVYGNNRTLLVRTGQEVARGQVVARLAEDRTGSSPHLHFQVRAEGKPVDPGRYLGRRATLMASAEAR